MKKHEIITFALAAYENALGEIEGMETTNDIYVYCKRKKLQHGVCYLLYLNKIDYKFDWIKKYMIDDEEYWDTTPHRSKYKQEIIESFQTRIQILRSELLVTELADDTHPIQLQPNATYTDAVFDWCDSMDIRFDVVTTEPEPVILNMEFWTKDGLKEPVSVTLHPIAVEEIKELLLTKIQL